MIYVQEKKTDNGGVGPLGGKIGYGKITYYTRKFGSDRAEAFLTRIKRDGRALGLDLSFEGKVGNTRDSHLLLLLAQRQSQAHLQRLESVLFRGAFEEGQDISDRRFLLAAAREAGLCEGDEEDVLAWLDDAEAIRMVDELERRTKSEVGIVAVPSFVVQGRYSVGGKQEESLFLDLFERIRKAEEGEKTGETAGKGGASVEQEC